MKTFVSKIKTSFKLNQPFNFLIKHHFSLNLLKTSSFNFSKKTSDNKKNDKKKEEKEKINKEYENISFDEIKTVYKNDAEKSLLHMKEKLAEIRVLRTNPKFLDNIPVHIKNKKLKLHELATVALRGANAMSITPFEEAHIDVIIKSLEASKLDIQITNEGNHVGVIIGDMPNDLKNEMLQSAKKIHDAAKEQLKDLRHRAIGECKKLEKVVGKDEAKRLEKMVLDHLEK